MKKCKLSNRILSLLLALVMVVGMVPMMSLTAHAATYTDGVYVLEATNFITYWAYNGAEESNLEVVGITDVTISVNANNQIACNFKVQFYNDIGQLRTAGQFSLTVENKSCTEAISHAFTATKDDGSSFYYEVTGTLTRAARTEHTGGQNTCVAGAVCSICGVKYGSVNPSAHNWGDWTYSEDGKHIRTCTLDSSHTESGNCTYSAATCLAASACSKCGHIYEAQKDHSYTYTADDFVLTEKCENGCGHQAIASIVAVDAIYTGSEITNAATISYDAGTWAGEKPVLSYTDNVNVGTATAKMSVGDATASTTFQINPANISGATVTLNPENGTYNGNAHTPSITVTYKDKALVEGTDYTVSWDKTDLTNADTYTVRVVGIGNFVGFVDKTFTINAASLKDVKVEQVGTLTYNGKALTPVVNANATAMGDAKVLFVYSADGSAYGSMPTFTEAGTYTVYYCAYTADNNFFDYYDTFTVTVDKAIVTEPTIASKPYTGEAQTADVPASDLYTVAENNGGEDAGEYNVVLSLKDSTNYKWSTTNAAQVTLEFKIDAAENSWTVTPSINGWTYGKTANAPVYEVKFGTVYVFYYGTANDGSDYSSGYAPTKAGNYTVEFNVTGTPNYNSMGKSVNFTIAKADYDMSGARWDYSGAFDYDGINHSVWFDETSLSDGVTVSNYTGNTASAVGKYTANVSLSYADLDNYNYPNFNTILEWEIKNDWTPTEYVVSAPNDNGWLNDAFTIIPAEGYWVSLTNTADSLWENMLTCSGETANGSVTFYLKNADNGKISLGKTVTYKLDKTAPTGKVEFVGRAMWQEFLNTVTFGLFCKDELTLKTTADDNLSGVASVEYYESDKAMTLDEVKAITNWTAYNGSFGVSVGDTKQFVYFVRITDNAGNVTYLSTDGVEYDTTAPAISGVETATYCTTRKVTVTDKNIAGITLNGENAGNEITLEGNKDAAYTIVATDKAGNSTTVTVTMKPIAHLSAPIDDLTEKNVNSADEGAVDGVKAAVAAVDTSHATEEEKAALKEISDKSAALEKAIDDTQKELTRVNGKLKKYDEDTVTSQDEAAIHKVIRDIDALLETDNLTSAQRKKLKAARTEAEGLLDAAEAAAAGSAEKEEEVTPEVTAPGQQTDSEEADRQTAPAEDDGCRYWWWILLLILAAAVVLGIVWNERKRKAKS